MIILFIIRIYVFVQCKTLVITKTLFLKIFIFYVVVSHYKTMFLKIYIYIFIILLLFVILFEDFILFLNVRHSTSRIKYVYYLSTRYVYSVMLGMYSSKIVFLDNIEVDTPKNIQICNY